MTAKAPPTVFRDERDDVVVLPAPGRPQLAEHPSMASFKKAMEWLMWMRELQRGGYSFYEANEITVHGHPEDN